MADQTSLPADSIVSSLQEEGKRIATRQREGRPRFSFPDISVSQATRDSLISALLGASSGVSAAQGAQDPISAALLGAGAGVKSGLELQNLRAQQAKAQMSLEEERLNSLPVEQVSPALAQKYPELAGIPLGIINKISPLIQKQDTLERQLIMLAAREASQERLAKIRSAETEARNNVTPEEAKLYEKNYKIPASVFAGMDKQVVRDQLVGFRRFQAQAEAVISAENHLKNLYSQWAKVKNRVGIVRGAATGAAAKVTGGAIATDLRAYQDARGAAVTSIRKLYNDSGAPSNFDVERLSGIIPSIYTSPNAAQKNWGFLMRSTQSSKDAIEQASPLTSHIFGKHAGIGGGGGEKVHVRRKSDGKTGYVSNPDPSVYEVIR